MKPLCYQYPMDMPNFSHFFAPENWYHASQGPRYLQLYRHVNAAVRDGRLLPDTQLPPEREIADIARVSRVTVRKAFALLVEEGAVRQRRGSGTFVGIPTDDQRLEHSLSTLTSFSEYMTMRGMVPRSQVLSAGLFAPAPQEQIALGLRPGVRVARIRRLRTADDMPMAIETSSLPEDILPEPGAVSTSLYDVLGRSGHVPVRAMQRIAATSVDKRDAPLIDLPVGAPVLRIDRTGYLASGRPVELTIGLYRSDIYEFIAELRRSDH